MRNQGQALTYLVAFFLAALSMLGTMTAPALAQSGENSPAGEQQLTNNTRSATGVTPQVLVFPGVLGVGGFFSSDDNFRHAFVAQCNGNLWEIFWNRQLAQGQVVITNFDPLTSSIVGVAGFFSPVGNRRHAIVGTDDGDVTDVSFTPALPGVQRALLANFNPLTASIVGIGGYFDNVVFDHAIVATSNGNVTDIHQDIDPGPPTQVVLTNFSPATGGIVGVASFFSSSVLDGDFVHVIVGTANGDVTEVFYQDPRFVGRALLANFNPLTSSVVAIGGFFSSDDNFRHAIVATDDGNVTEIFFNPRLGQGQDVLANFDPTISSIVGIAGFFSTDDNFRHVVVATSDGKIHEILFNPTMPGPPIVRDL